MAGIFYFMGVFLLWMESSPLQYYFYLVFPVIFWSQIYKSKPLIIHNWSLLVSSTRSLVTWLGIVSIFIVALETLVYVKFFYTAAVILLGQPFCPYS